MKTTLVLMGLLGTTMLVGCGEGLGHHGNYAKAPELGTTELTAAEVAPPARKESARPMAGQAAPSLADQTPVDPSLYRGRNVALQPADRTDPYSGAPVANKKALIDRNDPWAAQATPVVTAHPKLDRDFDGPAKK